LNSLNPIENLNIISFSDEIEHKYIRDRSDSYLTTIVKWCEENVIDFEDVTKYISPSLKEKIKLDGEEKGWLRRSSIPMNTSFF